MGVGGEKNYLGLMVQIVNRKEAATYKMMKHPKGMKTRVIVFLFFFRTLSGVMYQLPVTPIDSV